MTILRRLAVPTVAALALACAAPAAADTFTVINTNGSGAGSLAAAITSANGHAGDDTISFQIPAPGSAKIIVQSTPLPAITQAVTIDGASQGGIAATPITIDGTGNTGATDGVVFNGGGGSSTFDHITVKDFPGDGIDVPVAPSSGLTVAADVLRGNGQAGIHLGAAAGTKVTGSDIGNDGTTANPNGAAGVNIDQAVGVTVGAVEGQPFLGTHFGNLISGNTGDGILVANTAGDNTISGNLIGTDETGRNALPNGGDGIHVAAARGPTRIQAATLSSGSFPNVIAGNVGTGVQVDNAGINTVIDGNTIGDDNGPANGGDGVSLAGSQASVTNNTIDHNTQAGVRIGGVSANQNVVTGNRIGLSDSDSGAGNGDEGVRIENDASSNTIGGPAELDANTVSENGRTGVFAQGAGTGNVIQGNIVGTDSTGSVARGNNGDGIKADNSDNTSIVGNLSSGNHGAGVDTENASGLVVQGNTVGLNRLVTGALPNDLGIQVFSQNTTIGGTGAGQGNTVSGNSGAGIRQAGNNGRIVGNTIGLGASGRALPNGGDGVLIDDPGAVVGGPGGALNTISANAGAGVHVTAGNTATVAENAIFDNGALGIDNDPLGVTAAGAPVLASATVGNGPPTVTGTLTSAPNQSFTVRFFSSPSCDPSGFGEGRTPLGSTTVTTNGGGGASLTTTALNFGATDVITATATNNATGATSEFSACRPVTVIRTAVVTPPTNGTTTTTGTTTPPANTTAPPLLAAVPPVCKGSLDGNAGRLTVTVTCDRAATVTLRTTARITTKRKRRRARGAGTKRVALATKTVTVAAGKPTTVRLGVPRSVVAAVKRHAKVAVSVEANARTADGATDTQFASISRLHAAPKRMKKARR